MIRQKIIGNWPVLLCILFFCLNIFACYPGFVSPDTIDQYHQALTGVYDDWHPPVMALLWHCFLFVAKGTGPMLLFQLALLWTACAVLMSCFRSNFVKLLLLLFCCSPIVQNFAGYIVKDVHMAFSWLLAAALILRAITQDRRLSRIEVTVILLLLIYGTWVRINALPGVLPLLYLLVRQQFPAQKEVKRVVLSIAACVAVLLFTSGVQNKIIRPEKTHPEIKLFLQDLSGIYVHTNKPVFPGFLYEEPSFDTAYIRAHYTTATFDDIWARNMIVDGDSADALKHYWQNAIRQNLQVYLKNRYDGFLYFLRVKSRPNVHLTYYWYFATPNDYQFSVRRNCLLDTMENTIKLQENFVYMKPWFWLLLNVLLLPFAFIMKRHSKMRLPLLMLLVSSLFYLLPQFFIYQIDTDFRYFYWNCIACSLAAILLVNGQWPMVSFVKRRK